MGWELGSERRRHGKGLKHSVCRFSGFRVIKFEEDDVRGVWKGMEKVGV